MPGSMSPYDLPQPWQPQVEQLLRSGKWCLDWWDGDTDPMGGMEQVYYLRPTIKGREQQVFHAGWGGECTMLGPQGCTLPREEMPTGCRNLVPRAKAGMPCTGTYDKEQVAQDWRPHNTELWQIARRVQQEQEQ